MKRLYVGGLSHSVTEKDLKDRFGKFGKVEDVELKTRTDDQGVPFKTFGYINITISDSDLKKCLSVLNKSQWKGGTLQIETAKQSFLQRLSEEREQAAQLLLKPPEASPQQQILDSLREAGVSNFTMKSAVPGTEIPGHKDWVVGKFGRVLPVLQLNCRRGNKARTMKYDPSKYGHNLRALAPPPGPETTPTPVSQLTWEVPGGDDDISRKRRGEFPPFTPQRKKRKDSPPSDLIGSCNGSGRPVRSLRPPLDSESDEELRRIVHSSHDALGPEDDTLEVVSTEYSHTRRKDEDDCDSADTDELFSSRKPQKNQNYNKKQEVKHSTSNSTDEEGEEEDSGKKKKRKRKINKVQKSATNVMKQEEAEHEETSDGDDGGDDDGDSDHEYEALFSNVTRLEMSLSDLQTLAQRYAPETTTPRILSVDHLSASRTPKKGTTPEEILASILEGGSSDEEEEAGRKRKKQKKKRSMGGAALPAFRGTKGLDEEPEKKKSGGNMEETPKKAATSSEEEGEEELRSEGESNSEEEPETRLRSSSSDEERLCSESSSDEDEEDAMSQPIRAAADQEEAGQLQTANQRRPTAEEEAELQRRANERRLAAVHQRQKETEQNRRLIQGALSALDGAPGGSAGKHIVFGSDDDEDEAERTAPQQRAAQEQLSVAQSKPSSAPRLFGSDDDDDDDEEEEERFEIRPEFEGAAGQKLMALQSRFGTDERFKMDVRFLDDRVDDEDTEKTERQTEPEEGALLQEKQKNLHILQNLLGTTSAPPERTKFKTFRDVSSLHYDPSNEEHAAFEKKQEEQKESKASRRKKREESQKLPEVSKDIYFEVKADLKAVFGKDSQPEQDQDQDQEGRLRGGTSWDQEEEGVDQEEETQETKEEETGGFKFSFFGDDPEPQPQQSQESLQTEYKAESISAPRLSWQQDPRLNDSSDDEDEDDDDEGDGEEEAEPAEGAAQCAGETQPTSDLFFFFFTNDRRLEDGPQWFCSSSLDEQRESWEETRTTLRQDCKKKHKDARRKLRGSLQR